MFCRTLADTICAEDMEAMLCRALSFETWSWGGGDRGEIGVTQSPEQAGTPPLPQAGFAKQGIGGECPKYPPQNTAVIINARVPPVRDPPGP